MASVNDICRVCANEAGTLVAIYSQEGMGTQLEHKINLYLPIKVSKQDVLPLQCCCTCKSTIIAWHDLFEGCVKAEKRLRSFKIINPDPLSLDESSNHTLPYADCGDCNSEQDESSRPFFRKENNDAISHNSVESLCANIKSVSCDTNEHSASYSCSICKLAFFVQEDFIKHSEAHKIIRSLEQIEKSDRNCRKPEITIKRNCSVSINDKHCEYISAHSLETTENPSINAVPGASTCDIKRPVSKDNSNEVSVIIDNTIQNVGNSIKAIHSTNRLVEDNIESSKRLRREVQEKQIVLGEKKEKKLVKEDIEEIIDSVLKTCKLCGVSFEKKIDLNKHLLSQHNVKAQRIRKRHSEINVAAFCDLCDKGFTRKYDMLKHRNTKHGQSNSKNNQDQGVTKRLNLIEKCVVKDGDGNVVYKCNDCGHVFKHSYNLIRHHTIHTGEKAYFCELCAKKFRTASGLNRHLNEFHYAIKKFRCDVCDKRFTTRASQKEHMNIHTDTRPYVCDVCGKAYRQKASLHVHKTYHSDVFRFTCSVCGNKYRRAQELKVHHHSHTGHKPFKCQLCEARYRLRQDLNRHSLTHK